MLDAIGKGFSAMEVIWAVNSEGYVVPDSLLNRPQRRIQFDAYTRVPKVRTMTNPFYGDPMPDRKFIIHRNQQKYENPFGDALDEKVYWIWLFKRNVTKFWMQHLETNAAPVPIVQHPATADESLKNEALDIAAQIRNGSYGRIPENFEIMWAESKNAGTASTVYEQFIRYCNDEMTKCVLGEVLTTEGSSSSGHGAKSGASESRLLQKARVHYYAGCLQDTLNSTLIKWMIDYNFSDVIHYPQFTFDISEPPDMQMYADAISKLKNAGYKVDPEWIKTNLGLDIIEVVESKPIIQTGIGVTE